MKKRYIISFVVAIIILSVLFLWNVGAESRIAMRVQATAMYAENVVHKISDTDFAMKAKGINQAGKEEAVNSAIFASALSVTTNAVSVVKGEKDCKEAVKDTVKDTVTAAAAGYATGALMKQIALEQKLQS